MPPGRHDAIVPPCRRARRRPDNRHRAVPQAVHLVQAARLETRRHQEDVRARLDQMRERLVEPDARRRYAGMPLRPARAELLDSGPRRSRERPTSRRAPTASASAAIRSSPSDRPSAKSSRRAAVSTPRRRPDACTREHVRLQCRLPARSSRRYCAGRDVIASGIPSRVSMPFRDPDQAVARGGEECRRSRTRISGVWISCA